MGSIWTLRRSATDAKVAGLCGAVAERFGIDPLVVRVVTVILMLSSGLGMVAYLAGWLLLPKGVDPEAPLFRAVPSARRLSPSGWMIVVLVGAACFSLMSGQLVSFGILPALTVVALWYFGAFKPNRSRPGALTTARHSAQPFSSGRESEFQTAARAWTERVGEQRRSAGGAVPPWLPPADSRPPVQPTGFYRSPVPANIRATTLVKAPAHWGRLGTVTVTAAVAVAAVLGSVAYATGHLIPTSMVLAAGLFVLALGLLTSAWVGRQRGLIAGTAVVALLTMATMAPVTTTLQGQGFGQGFSAAPLVVAEIPEDTTIAVGTVYLDLTQLDVTADHTATITVGVGDVTILLPPEGNVEVSFEVARGSVTDAEGQTISAPVSGGFGSAPVSGGPMLHLHVEVGSGNVEVH